MDLTVPPQGCIPPGCEVHLHKYLLSLQVHEGKIEMHTSLLVYMCEVAGQEQYAILNYVRSICYSRFISNVLMTLSLVLWICANTGTITASMCTIHVNITCNS